ncbi:hypothetical protein FACS1894180_2480 [Bacteroidia bacterium]|nr:hypothetical protein FACS1894180_2480 [Bacteroidia bacterium]
MTLRESYKIYVQIVLANVFWGFSFVWTDVALRAGIQPVTLVAARLAIATALLGMFAFFTHNIQKISLKHLKYFLALALFEPFLYFLCETYGQTLVSPTVTSVIIATIPVFTLLAAIIFLKEKVNFMTSLGIIISLLGVLAVVFVDYQDFKGQIVGTLLVFGAVVVSIAYAVFVKYLTAHYNATTIVFYQNLIGLLYFVPCFFLIDFQHINQIKITSEALWAIVLLAVFASVIAFIFYSRAIRIIGVAKAGVFCYVIPVLTALFAYFIVNEKLTLVQWCGILLVMAGLFVSQTGKKN